MPGPYLTRERGSAWAQRLDRTFGWLPFDWRLLAPFFLLGAAAGVGGFLWLFYLAAGAMG